MVNYVLESKLIGDLEGIKIHSHQMVATYTLCPIFLLVVSGMI
jgi:hypothetical protein